ncbi:hypothetical protein ES288_D05G400300v1 [Gossypium darwinii]|uniref:Uncharacterized protein n=1 Tax=Gossypium darwinii TaxID=34276 RepID=A0A5D2CPI9_GOSDA|nr:hypothetical protein ES288_D05G400300v1 [Gossypium darwinii]
MPKGFGILAMILLRKIVSCISKNSKNNEVLKVENWTVDAIRPVNWAMSAHFLKIFV